MTREPETTVRLPTWRECSRLVEHGIGLTALQQFIYDNEPAGGQDEAWRKALAAAIEELVQL